MPKEANHSSAYTSTVTQFLKAYLPNTTYIIHVLSCDNKNYYVNASSSHWRGEYKNSKSSFSVKTLKTIKRNLQSWRKPAAIFRPMRYLFLKIGSWVLNQCSRGYINNPNYYCSFIEKLIIGLIPSLHSALQLLFCVKWSLFSYLITYYNIWSNYITMMSLPPKLFLKQALCCMHNAYKLYRCIEHTCNW